MKDEIRIIIERLSCKECGAFYGYDQHKKMIDDAIIEIQQIKNSVDLGDVSHHTLTKKSMQDAYVQGYRKHAINAESKYDSISENYAKVEFENWFNNLYIE